MMSESKVTDMSLASTEKLSVNSNQQHVVKDTNIEKRVRDFVHSKTGENVHVDFTKDSTIKIVPKAKQGSIALGILWVKVLQHPKNYPVTKYPYKKQVGPDSDYDIVLTLHDVTIHVNLKTGLLQSEGRFVIDWFMKYFNDILDIYDGLPVKKPKAIKNLYTDEEVKRFDLDIQMKKQSYADNWPEAALKDETSVVSFNSHHVDLVPIETDVPLDLQVPGIRNSDLMTPEEIETQTSNLTPGSIIEGPRLYRLWRSLLNMWCSNENSMIYIASPRIDTTRLIEICEFCLKHRQTVNLAVICIPMNFDGCFLANIKREALKRFSPQEQIFIEYRVFTQFLYPLQNFEAKFIASLNQDGIVDILVTSADFNKFGFSCHNKNMVVYNSVLEEEFKTKYLNPVMDY